MLSSMRFEKSYDLRARKAGTQSGKPAFFGSTTAVVVRLKHFVKVA
jgi:hypothetical protein